MNDQIASWKRIRSGDRGEFEAFYGAHSARIFQFLCHMTGNRQVAVELLQEVFLHLWERANGFDPERGDLINYVFGIARNRAAEWRRDCKRHPDAPDTGAETTSPRLAVDLSTASFSRGQTLKRR